MRPKKAVFILSIALLASVKVCYSQYSKSKKIGSFNGTHVSRSKARVICPIFQSSQYPYQAIGFKLGDPFALSYKFYPNKNWAFAADGGKASSGLYNKYYRNAFDSYLPDSLTVDESLQYRAHKAKVDWFLETKFLYQWNAEKFSKGLQLYAGLGWQWRNTKLQYDSQYSNIIGEDKIIKFSENRFTYGPVGVLGFEYSYFSLPISAFIEVEWFTDVLLDPGYQRFQGGVGLRYVF
jgi:hypothetical protein